MKRYLRYFTRFTLCDQLELFESRVIERKYKKLDYNAWRTLKTIAAGDDEYEPFEQCLEMVLYPARNMITIDGIDIGVSNDFIDVILNEKWPEAEEWPTVAVEEDTIIATEEREEKSMNMPKMNFDFGPCGDSIAISPYGLAIRNKETWLTYNPNTKQTIDVTGFTFDFKGALYKVPVAISAVVNGDLILHQGRPMFVTGKTENEITAIDLMASEAKFIVPVTNMFGFNFIIKIVNIMNFGNSNPSPESPFGNIMQYMIMSELFNSSEKDSKMDFGKMMMFSAMSGNTNIFGNMFNFPMNNNQ